MGKPQMKLIALLMLGSLVQVSCATATSAAPALTPAPTSAPKVLSAGPTVAATALAIPTEAPTAGQPSGGPLYIVINPPGDEYAELQDSFIQTANSLGAQAEKFDDVYDKQASIGQVNDAIQAGAKGIAMEAVLPAYSGPGIAKAAKAAGVVLIAVRAAIKDADGKPLPMIGFDDKELGKQAGEAASKLLDANGWLKDSTRKVGVLSLEVRNQPTCNQRTDSAKAVIKTAGVPANQIFPLQYDVIMIDTQDTTGAILKAHADITNWVVFGCTDFGSAGALQAFAAAGVKTEDIIAIGIGTTEACIPWAAGQPTGFKATVFISSRDIGKMAATVLNDAVVNGQTPPAVTLVPPTVVDATDFKTLMDPLALAKCSK